MLKPLRVRNSKGNSFEVLIFEHWSCAFYFELRMAREAVTFCHFGKAAVSKVPKSSMLRKTKARMKGESIP